MMGQAKQDTGYGIWDVRVARHCEITADDLHDAYVFARLRRIGIGYVQAIESPDLLAALRGTARARKAKQIQTSNPTPPGLPLSGEVQSELFEVAL